MAKANDEFDFLGSEYVDVNTVVNHQTVTRRNPAAGKMSSTGRTEFNTNATEIQDAAAKPYGLTKNYYVKYKVNMNNKTVALIPVESTVIGASEVRRNSDGKTIVLYLHGVFEEYPELRPAGDVEVKVTLHPSGKAAIINLASGGLSVRHLPRGSSSTEAASKETSKDATKDTSK